MYPAKRDEVLVIEPQTVVNFQGNDVVNRQILGIQPPDSSPEIRPASRTKEQVTPANVQRFVPPLPGVMEAVCITGSGLHRLPDADKALFVDFSAVRAGFFHAAHLFSGMQKALPDVGNAFCFSGVIQMPAGFDRHQLVVAEAGVEPAVSRL